MRIGISGQIFEENINTGSSGLPALTALGTIAKAASGPPLHVVSNLNSCNGQSASALHFGTYGSWIGVQPQLVK